jgi:hypothetical protein
MDRATVGRIVHYVAPGSSDGTFPPAHRAAIVTEVEPDGPDDLGAQLVNLMVCNPAGVHFPQRVLFEPSGTAPFTWHWPERIGQTDAG